MVILCAGCQLAGPAALQIQTFRVLLSVTGHLFGYSRNAAPGPCRVSCLALRAKD